MASHPLSELDLDLLELYLNDHLTGATAGRARVRHMVQAYADLPIHEALCRLADELEEEHRRLRTVITDLGLAVKRYRQIPAEIGERLGRLKLNNRLLGRSPMSPFLEIELLRGAVNAKSGLWETLHDLSPALGLDAAEWQTLAGQAQDQDTLLRSLHAQLRTQTFARQ
ncbi:hypothetical protein [Ornithinimicrobium murale]|uniref:hypothetical protein n=1 Tax=Ornithinimicrobium murale TaxID=1050153 RepID=UPI000E0CFFE2|nr:hypothetical protein [Ornithinimicrobium murale]